MKKFILLLGLISLSFVSFSQTELLKDSPIYIEGDVVMVGVNAKTTDDELLEIRTKLLKFTTIRFTEFDVIRANPTNKKEEGDIQFISMEVDCRDGYSGKISHSFEQGDTSTFGFYRDYSKNTYNKAFFIGNLSNEKLDFIIEKAQKKDTQTSTNEVEE
ncbi:MAG: hypothetical protein PHG98_00670 [Bacteroidales bacterium]|jgi:hypothetical protein|nr:hypothetical protein [Bacteroidales bacterium]MDD3287238.1 hypothetical protein [Bacteroidales bacterium]MDD4067671.1 hypothetical protein [Bacteroidales bacterium]MDD4738448.1 hypothetical protein [Bacteroidales bacterium]MDY4789676.1 hypothetical protein [Bacteroidales bacterium]